MIDIKEILISLGSAIITSITTYFVTSRKLKKDEFSVLYDQQMELISKIQAELEEQKRINKKLESKIEDLSMAVYKLNDGIVGIGNLPFPA
ncbi:MAG: hypothetical protein CUN55_18400, partial [Phototrophicales bacterium]